MFGKPDNNEDLHKRENDFQDQKKESGNKTNRRDFLLGGGIVAAGAVAAVSGGVLLKKGIEYFNEESLKAKQLELERNKKHINEWITATQNALASWKSFNSPGQLFSNEKISGAAQGLHQYYLAVQSAEKNQFLGEELSEAALQDGLKKNLVEFSQGLVEYNLTIKAALTNAALQFRNAQKIVDTMTATDKNYANQMQEVQLLLSTGENYISAIKQFEPGSAIRLEGVADIVFQHQTVISLEGIIIEIFKSVKLVANDDEKIRLMECLNDIAESLKYFSVEPFKALRSEFSDKDGLVKWEVQQSTAENQTIGGSHGGIVPQSHFYSGYRHYSHPAFGNDGHTGSGRGFSRGSQAGHGGGGGSGHGGAGHGGVGHGG